MRKFEEKVVNSKKTAWFVATVFLFVTVLSLLSMTTAYAGTSFHVHTRAETSVSITYLGSPLSCTPNGGRNLWSASDNGDYVSSGISGITVDGVWIPASALGIGVEAGGTINIRSVPALTTYSVVHNYYTSIDGGTPVLDGFTGPATHKSYVGAVINPDNIGRVTGYNGNTYTFTGVTPNTSQTLTSSGVTFTLSYIHNVTTVPYTIVHEYYTSSNGGAFSLTGSTSSTATGIVGNEVNLNGISRVTSYGGNSYTYVSSSPASNPTLAAGLVITLRYERSLADYTVIHEYFTNIDGGPFSKDGSDSDEQTGVVGSTVHVNAITKDNTYGMHTYTYQSVSPSSDFTLTSSGATIRLRYERSLSTASYNIVHEYYTSENGGAFALTGSVNRTESGIAGNGINIGAIAQMPTYNGNTYTYISTLPAANPILTAGLTITLRYERSITTAPVIIEHRYYTSIDGLPFAETGFLSNSDTAEVGSTVDLSLIPRVPGYSGDAYSYISITPSVNPTVPAGGLTITLRYERNLATSLYNIVHEYYTSTNGAPFVLDGSDNTTGSALLGTEIDVNGIAKDNTYGGNTYAYASVSPANNPVFTSAGLTITLRYERSITLYTITTSVVNGMITPAESGIAAGADRTVTYAPNAGYHLLSVTVDGNPQNISVYPDSFPFNSISANHTINVVYEADPNTGTLNISKVDAATQAPLSGAVFNIYRNPGLTDLAYSGLVSGVNGQVSIADVPAGDYWVTETAPPAGYAAFTGSIPVKVTAGQPVTVVIPNTAELGFGTGDLKIVKTDASSGKALKGAVFNVYSDSTRTTLAGSLTTNSAGVALLEGLDPATYNIVEITAPSGYKKLSGTLTAVIIQNEVTTLNIQNSKTVEQDYQTGTDDHNMLIAGGILLIIGLGLLTLYRKKAKA